LLFSPPLLQTSPIPRLVNSCSSFFNQFSPFSIVCYFNAFLSKLISSMSHLFQNFTILSTTFLSCLFFLILLHGLHLWRYFVPQIFSYKTSHELSLFLSIPLLIFLPSYLHLFLVSIPHKNPLHNLLLIVDLL
jgi:hypothetical protein